MSKQFRKYRFGSKGAYTTKANALPHIENEEGELVPSHSHLIVELGHEVITPATYDEEGEILTEAVYGDAYLVDVLWDGEADASWNNQVVWCAPLGVHTFGSSTAIAEWVNKCKELHPEYFPTPDDLIEE